MLRVALLLSVALLASLLASAATASTVIPVSGEVRALAFSGNALVVARLTSSGALVLERLVAGSPTQTILQASATSVDNDDSEVTLAASAEAVALGLNPDPDDDFGPSRVMVGPPRGPLREVATCPAGLIVSPVAVAGPRVAWREGACGEPAESPSSVSPAAIAVGGADPAAPVRRTAIPGERLVVGLVLDPGDTGIVGTVAPSFFAFDTEIRAFGPAGLGSVVTASRGGLVSPVGGLADGTRVFLKATIDADADDCDAQQLFTIAPAAPARRPVALGGCLLSASTLGPRDGAGPLASGDKIAAFLGSPPSRDRPRQRAVSLVSARGDGSDRRVVVKGAYRQPEGLALDGGRIAWWHPRCSGGREIVVQAAPEPTVKLAACRAEVLTRSARMRGGRIRVRLRCPAGCAGSIYSRRGSIVPFSFEAGTHRVSLPVALGKRRRASLPFDVSVEHGPSRAVTISVRR